MTTKFACAIQRSIFWRDPQDCYPYNRSINNWHFRSSHFQRLSITLRCLATGNNSEVLKLIRVTSQSAGIVVLETRLLRGRRTVTEWILHNTVHRLLNILCNGSTL